MTRTARIRPEFVEVMPTVLQEGVLYVSIPFATAIHVCCCGCGMRVVTPLRPSQWAIVYDGRDISLHPSIGNRSYPCRSHYWIRNGRVVWARAWEAEESEISHRQRSSFEAIFALLDDLIGESRNGVQRCQIEKSCPDDEAVKD